MTDVVVAAVDVGAVRNIGYWRDAPGEGEAGGHRLDDLAGRLATDLTRGRSVALGLEAPLFVPLPEAAGDLNRQRAGERGRPWCAGAGTGAFAMGAQQSAWLLRAIARSLRVAPPVTFDPADFANRGGLLIWEAFVSGDGKDRKAAEPHIDDARRAVAEFRRRLRRGVMESDITETVVFIVIGAAVLAAGLATDTTLLSQPCTVVRVPDLVA
jgi:hypothetical protein